jgi:hypothetical protein
VVSSTKKRSNYLDSIYSIDVLETDTLLLHQDGLLNPARVRARSKTVTHYVLYCTVLYLGYSTAQTTITITACTTALHNVALHIMHRTTLHCTSLCAPHCTAQHCTAHHCAVQHCTAHHCTDSLQSLLLLDCPGLTSPLVSSPGPQGPLGSGMQGYAGAGVHTPTHSHSPHLWTHRVHTSRPPTPSGSPVHVPCTHVPILGHGTKNGDLLPSNSVTLTLRQV